MTPIRSFMDAIIQLAARYRIRAQSAEAALAALREAMEGMAGELENHEAAQEGVRVRASVLAARIRAVLENSK